MFKMKMITTSMKMKDVIVTTEKKGTSANVRMVEAVVEKNTIQNMILKANEFKILKEKYKGLC